jgi:hypothetical protein
MDTFSAVGFSPQQFVVVVDGDMNNEYGGCGFGGGEGIRACHCQCLLRYSERRGWLSLTLLGGGMLHVD